MRARNLTTLALTVAAVLASPAAFAQGADLNRPGSLQLRQNIPANDLQILQNRQSRQNFQDQQQIYRQQERDSNTRLERPVVPRVDGNCRIQVYGNTYRTVCR